MGATYTIGIGYGIEFDMYGKVTDRIGEETDLEFLLEDYYPLLAAGTSGHYDGDMIYLVLVKSTHEEDFDFIIRKKKFAKTKDIDPEALDQMKTFCKKYGAEYKPEWKIFSTAG